MLSSGALIAIWLVTRAVEPSFSSLPERVTFAGVLATLGRARGAPAARRRPSGQRNRAARGSELFRCRWAVAAGLLFVFLFLFATGALAWVDADMSQSAPVPSVQVDSANGWSFQSPWVTIVLTDHLLFGTSWVVAVFLLAAGVLVSLNTGFTVGLARCAAACRPQAGGVLAVAPAFLAAPTCCGAGLPLGFALGGGTIAPVLSATPWLLLATTILLAGNLLFLLRRRRALGRVAPAQVATVS